MKENFLLALNAKREENTPGLVYFFTLLITAALLAAVGLCWAALVVYATIPLLIALSMLAAVLWTKRGTRFLRWSRQLKTAKERETPLAAALIPQLYGAYPPYVIEAAEKLGESKDRTAVPALMHVLEQCVDSQRPGWRDVAAALADALASIGDGRALDLLYRLENVRGIGFIPNIRNAIALIEPQAVLLRAGSADDAVQAAMLLRPASGSKEREAGLLLRPVDSEAS